MARSPKHQELRRRIEEIGIIPSVHARSADAARFAAQTVYEAGIPLVEVSMTVPDALGVIAQLVRDAPGLIVGADSVWDLESARRAIDAGAMFITSPGLESRGVLEFVINQDTVAIPGALTPSEVCAAWQAGADFVKVFPCAAVGGPRYIRTLRGPWPDAPLIAAGGVNQRTAADFIHSGALAIGVGTELMPTQAVEKRNSTWIEELVRRFVSIVKEARGLAR